MDVLRRHRALFQLAISLALVGLLMWRVDIGEAVRSFGEANYIYVLPALPIYTLSKLVDALRWQLMLAPVGRAPAPGLFGIYLIANMTNNVVPVRLGDVLRVQVPAQRYGLPRASLTATVFVTESLLDGVAFAALALTGVMLLDAPDLPINLVWALVAAVIVGLAIALLLASLPLRDGWYERGWMVWLAPRVRETLGRLIPEFVRGLLVLRQPALAARTLGLTAVAWLLEASMYALFGLAFGLELEFSAYLIIMVAANMIVAMPVAPSNIGPYELATAEVVAALGVRRPLAGAYVIAVHILNILWVGVCGLVAMWVLRLGFEDLFSLRRGAAVSPRPDTLPGSP